MVLKSQMIFAEVMDISYIRIQEVRLDYDHSNVYVSAKVLDRSPTIGKTQIILTPYTKIINTIQTKN